MPDHQTVESPTPPAARRFSRPTTFLVLALALLLMVCGALVVTAPSAKSIRALEPKDQRPASADFLQSAPRPPQPTPDAEALLLAKSNRLSRSGPRALFTTPPPATPYDSQAPSRPDGPEPPPGVYRPYISPSANRQPPPSPAPPWQASFASSLKLSSPAASSEGNGLLAALAAAPFSPSQLPAIAQLPALAQGADTVVATPLSGSPSTTPAPPNRAALHPAPIRLMGNRTLKAGTLLTAILLTAVSTQLPGDAVAHLTNDVYAVDGSVLLPKGTRLLGSYGNRVTLGDNRLAIAWDRLELPDGRSYSVEGLPATAPDGAPGVPGRVNNHTGLVFGRAAVLSLIGAAAQLGQPRQSRLGAELSDREVIAGSTSQQLTQASSDYLNRAVNVNPTITIPAGQVVQALLPYDLELPLR